MSDAPSEPFEVKLVAGSKRGELPQRGFWRITVKVPRVWWLPAIGPNCERHVYESHPGTSWSDALGQAAELTECGVGRVHVEGWGCE